MRSSTKMAKEIFKDRKIIAAEIGVYKAENAKSILDNLNVEKLFLIDPYKVYNDTSSAMGKTDMKLIEEEAHYRLKDYKNVVWVKKESEAAAKELPELHLCYIDGNHEYEFVKKDIEIYYAKIKSVGMLTGHDIRWKAGVKKAFFEFINKKEILSYTLFRDDWIIIK